MDQGIGIHSMDSFLFCARENRWNPTKLALWVKFTRLGRVRSLVGQFRKAEIGPAGRVSRMSFTRLGRGSDSCFVVTPVMDPEITLAVASEAPEALADLNRRLSQGRAAA